MADVDHDHLSVNAATIAILSNTNKNRGEGAGPRGDANDDSVHIVHSSSYSVPWTQAEQVRDNQYYVFYYRLWLRESVTEGFFL